MSRPIFLTAPIKLVSGTIEPAGFIKGFAIRSVRYTGHGLE
jgi:hypothetical protein